MPHILAFDLGTTALKCALHDLKGTVIAKASEEYQLITPRADWVEMDVETYWQAFKSAVSTVLKESGIDPAEIRALGVSAQGETLILVDREGKPLRRAIVWLDNQAQSEAERLGEIFGHRRAFEITGQVKLVPTWPASKILWLRKNEPETIIAYQLMGKNSDGEVCPFLNTEGAERSPHGGFKCKIYDKKPVACSAYPVNIEDKETVTLDRKCKFCRVNNKDGEQANGMEIQKFSVRKEIIALRKIQNSTQADASVEIWRYATGIGEKEKQELFYPRGWVLQDDVQ